MAVSRTLELDFLTQLSKTHKLRVHNAKENLDSGEISNAMDNIITANIFSGSGGELTTKKGARMIVKETTDFDLI